MSLAHREKLLVSGKRIDFSGSCDRIHCCGFCSVAVIAKSNQVMGEMSILAYIFRPQSITEGSAGELEAGLEGRPSC